MNKHRTEFGDWQTSYDFAKRICELLKKKGVCPSVILEPTCGEGNFIFAALDTFDTITDVYAVEIYKPYIDSVKDKLSNYSHITSHIFHENIFLFDFSSVAVKGNILILGNPPWVTNSQLGELASTNLPLKTNFKSHKGVEAITGKGNFDIAEYVILMLLKTFSKTDGHIGMLVKNSVIKNLIKDQNLNRFTISEIHQYEFNAQKEFGAATSASLLFAKLNSSVTATCCIYDLYADIQKKKIGLLNDKLIADFDSYGLYANIDGLSPLTWRSGLKHDCSKIMELTLSKNSCYKNELEEELYLEPEYIYPLIKSSDIKGSILTTCRKHVIVPQKHTNDDTRKLGITAPLTYAYLHRHKDKLDGRKSKIYTNRPRFCIFGVGDYSFLPYKIVISALYDKTEFTFVGTIDSKPVMLDDTCYMLGFEREDYALITQKILNSTVVQGFIKSIYFPDAKRPINKDLLMRIDLQKAAAGIGFVGLGISESLYEEYKNWLRPGSSDCREGIQRN